METKLNSKWMVAGVCCTFLGLGMIHPGLMVIAFGGLCFLWADDSES